MLNLIEPKRLTEADAEQMREHISKSIAEIKDARASLTSEAAHDGKADSRHQAAVHWLTGNLQKAGVREQQEHQAALFQVALSTTKNSVSWFWTRTKSL
jgi:hypothetical protein